MAIGHNPQDQSSVTGFEPLTRILLLPDGYELAQYTLRRVHDGHLQSYLPVNAGATTVQAVPIAAQPSGLQSHGVRQPNQEDSIAGFPAPNAFTNQSPYRIQVPSQQLYNIPIRGGPKSIALPHSESKGLSERTQKRHAHSRDDDYTDVCGVYSAGKATPVQKYNHGEGEFYCPRCGSNFTRPKSVKDHFPDCVSKCGNPQSLRYTDHPSMAQTEAAIQRRGRASREASNLNTERVDCQTAENGQGVKDEEMSDAGDHTYMHDVLDSAPVEDRPHIKTEFVYGADVAYESIETPSPGQQSQSAELSLQPTSAGGRYIIAQTPDCTRYDSPTPTLDTVPWSSGGTSTSGRYLIEQTPDWTRYDTSTPTLDTVPRATLPPEWTPEAETPKGSSGDGLQYDGFDGLMDRRSVVPADEFDMEE